MPRARRRRANRAKLAKLADMSVWLSTLALGAVLEHATFAGGCFWCMEEPFDGLPGVSEVLPGYTGGTKNKPTYAEVSSGSTGHAEAVDVTFDPAKITYDRLLDVYWHQVDPTNADGQFCDHGHQYRSAIFYHGEKQKAAAEASRAALNQLPKFKAKVVTEITEAKTFFPAEEYHQHYYKKNPVRYGYYRFSCGRDRVLNGFWGGGGGGSEKAPPL